MKIIYKITFHPLFYLFAFLCILTGLFKDFIIFTFIILIHESGHIIAGLLLKQKIEKIIFLPFGGITIFNMQLNTKLSKEFIIATSGPLLQFIFFIILYFSTYNIKFYQYNMLILIFNLLPIYPLDGSKILNVFCSLFLSYKNSFRIMMIISMILILSLVILSRFNFILIIIMLFLLLKMVREILNYKNIYNKFLFERYYYHLNFSKLIYIKKISNFHRNKRHILIDGKRCITEKEILRKRFDFQRNI